MNMVFTPFPILEASLPMPLIVSPQPDIASDARNTKTKSNDVFFLIFPP